jgi:DNA gyrase subunit A
MVTPKTGEVTAARIVDPDQELMIMSAAGVVIRTTVEGIRIVGRSSQGVSLMKPDPEDNVISITAFEPSGSAVGEKPPLP